MGTAPNKAIQEAAEQARMSRPLQETQGNQRGSEMLARQAEANKYNQKMHGNTRGFGVRTQTAGVGVKDLMGFGAPQAYAEPKVAKVNVRHNY